MKLVKKKKLEMHMRKFTPVKTTRQDTPAKDKVHEDASLIPKHNKFARRFFPAAYFRLQNNSNNESGTTLTADDDHNVMDCADVDDDVSYYRRCASRNVHSDKKMYYSHVTTLRLRAEPHHSPLIARKLQL